MSTPDLGLTSLSGYGLTPEQVAAPVDPHLIPDSHRWIFFDVTAPHKRYVINPTTAKFVPLGLYD